MQAIFERSMSHNYMIPDLEYGVKPDDFQVHMLSENHINGLLLFSVKTINCQTRYYYDITSHLSMRQLYDTEVLGEKEIQIFLKGLYEVLNEMKNYLLDGNKIVLDPDWIYLDVESRKPSFCYLPVFEGNLGQSFEKLSEYLLHKLDQGDSRAVLLGYDIYRQSRMPNYSLQELLKKSMGEMTEKESISKIPMDVQKKVEPILQEKSSEDINDRIEKMILPKDTKSLLSNEKKMDRIHSVKNHVFQKKLDKNLIFWGMILTGMLVLIGMAFWFGILDNTQAGGLTFLLIGLLGYGMSAQKKQKEKVENDPFSIVRRQEEKAEHRRRRKEKGRIRKEGITKESPIKGQGIDEKEYVDEKNLFQIDAGKRENEESEGVEFGATTVLKESEGDYQPHLGLISMNSRDRTTLILVKDQYMIGKKKGKVDLCIDAPTISRIHAKIVRSETGEYELCDMNSTNGTFLNGRRLDVNERVPISLSDEIHFAEVGYYVGNF